MGFSIIDIPLTILSDVAYCLHLLLCPPLTSESKSKFQTNLGVFIWDLRGGKIRAALTLDEFDNWSNDERKLRNFLTNSWFCSKFFLLSSRDNYQWGVRILLALFSPKSQNWMKRGRKASENYLRSWQSYHQSPMCHHQHHHQHFTVPPHHFMYIHVLQRECLSLSIHPSNPNFVDSNNR